MQHGYSARTHRSDGIAEPLSLGAVAVHDGASTILIITVDIVGIHTTEVEKIATAIESATDVPADHVLVCASHTHFAPQISTGMFTTAEIGFFEPEERDIERVISAAVSASKEAVGTLRNGELQTVRVPVPSVCFNRRTVRPDGMVDTNFRYPTDGDYTISPVDEELTALRFTSPDGTGAVIVNYGCHPVTGGYDPAADHYRVSSDYIHYLRRSIEDAWGFPTVFTLGAAGDVVPRDRYGESRRRIGTVLGESVVLADRLFSQIDGNADGDIAVRRISVPVKTIAEFDTRTAVTEYEAARTAAVAAASDGSSKAGEAGRDMFGDALWARFRSDLYPENRFDVPIQLIRIGSVKIAALPFEVLSEFSTRMKQEYPESILISCANGYQGYLPFAYEYSRGGYEASAKSTHFEAGTADLLYDRVIEEFRSL